jgi:hypothetical protein
LDGLFPAVGQSNLILKIYLVLGIPATLLPVERGHCNECVFGDFDLCYGTKIYSCTHGTWPLNGIIDMAKVMYTTEELPHSRRWSLRGNMRNVKRIVIFEKRTLARKFWGELTGYLIKTARGFMRKNRVGLKNRGFSRFFHGFSHLTAVFLILTAVFSYLTVVFSHLTAVFLEVRGLTAV